MKLKDIIDKHPLPTFVGKNLKLIGYEAYRSVGNKLLKGDTIESILAQIKGKKTYPPYEIHLVLEAMNGSFSLPIGFNGPDYNLIHSAGVWLYHENLHTSPNVGENQTVITHTINNHSQNNNKVSSKKFKDWYLSLMLAEFVK